MHKNLTLKAVIRLVFLVVLALALTLGGVLYLLLKSQQQVSQTQETRYQYFNSANMLRLTSNDMSAHIRSYVATGNRDKLNAYQEVLAIIEGQAPRVNGRTQTNQDMLAEMELMQDELKQLEQGRQATLTMARLEREAIELMAAGRQDEARERVLGPLYDEAGKALSDSVNTFVSLLLARQAEQLNAAESRNQQMVILMVSLVVLLVGLSLLLGWTLKRMVLQPLGAEPSEMERVAHSIAEGDLSLSFAANSSGVYGKLQHMTDKLREVIGHIHQSSSSLSAAAEETSAVSLQTSANLSRQQQDTDQVAAAINQMAATVQEVSQNTSLAAASANSANEAAEQGPFPDLSTSP